MANKRLSPEEKLSLVIDELKEKIASGDEKKETIAELLQSYPDLPSETTLRKWTKEVTNQTTADYFKAQGVLLSHRELYTKLLKIMSNDNETCAESGQSEESFYDFISVFDCKKFLAENDAWSKADTEYPKGISFVVETADGRSITVKNRIGSKMKDADPGRHFFTPHFFDINTARQNLLSEDEAADMMFRIEDTSDAWTEATPIVDPKAPEISYDEAQKRFEIFVGIAHLIGTEEWIKKIIEIAPKKKNGSFHKNRVVRIASSGFVETGQDLLYTDHKINIIYAKTDGDNEIALYAENRNISEEELEAVSKDFLSLYWKSLGLNKYIDSSSRTSVRGATKEYNDGFRVEDGERLFIEDSKDKDLFLAELGIFDSVTIVGNEITIKYPHQNNYYIEIDGNQMLINVEGVHEAVTDMWCSLLCFRGLYDYKNWDAKRQKVKITYNDKGERIFNGQILPSFYRGIGDPTYDCRMLKVRKYSFKDSIIRFARYIEGFEKEFDEWLEQVMRKKNKYRGSFVQTHDFRPGHRDETNTWALYPSCMPNQYGSYIFPPYTSHSFYVEILSDALRLYFR